MPSGLATDGQSDIADALMQCSTDCIKILDTGANIRFFNPSGLAQMELTDMDQVLGVYWPSLWPESSRPLLEQSLADARGRGTAHFAAARPTAKGNPKWWDVNIAAIPGGRFVVISRDITAQRARESEDRKSLDRFAAVFNGNDEVLLDIDLAAGTVWWGEGAASLFGYGPGETGDTIQSYHDLIHPDDRAHVTGGVKAAIDRGDLLWQGEFRYRKADGTYLEIHDRCSIVRDTKGKAQRLIGVMKDVTARNVVSAQEKLMAGELAHRVNNSIAVISGIFHQTVRASADLKQFSEIFGNRLLALANANSVLLRGGWNGAELGELAAVQLAPYVSKGQMEISGPRMVLPINIAQALALALNELATNAMKYGALSNGAGSVGLSWTALSGENGELVQLSWIERGGPPVAGPPARKGLGSKLIENGIPGARVTREFPAGGFRCRIELPVPEIG